MKQFILLALMVLSIGMGTCVYAADNDTIKKSGIWNITSTPTFKIDQKFYDNWSATGNSLIALTGTFFGNYKYSNDRFIWDNVINLAYGYSWQDLVKDTNEHGFDKYDARRKSDDKIDLTSTFSMRLQKSWNINASANFKTQFGFGYKYPTAYDEDKILVSQFMAPAYLTTSLGFECKEKDWNVSLSFLTGKTTFVVDDSLIAAGYDYGVLQDEEEVAKGHYTHAYFGLGTYIKFFYKKDITKHLNLYARVEFFYDYKKSTLMDWKHMDHNSEEYRSTFFGRRAYETDVDWELTLTYKFNAWLSTYFSMNMKYDTDFMGEDGILDRWQMYQNAGIQVYFNWKK